MNIRNIYKFHFKLGISKAEDAFSSKIYQFYLHPSAVTEFELRSVSSTRRFCDIFWKNFDRKKKKHHSAISDI